MISESVVLLTVEHFQHSRGRISPEIVGHFIYLVQQHNGIHAACELHSVYYTSRHRTYISLSMTSDIALVLNAAERYSYKIPSQRTCNALGNRCFADTRRSHKAEYLSLYIGSKRSYGKVFKYSFLDLFQTVVIVIKYLGSLFNIGPVLGERVPRQRKHGIEVVCNNNSFLRAHWHV